MPQPWLTTWDAEVCLLPPLPLPPPGGRCGTPAGSASPASAVRGRPSPPWVPGGGRGGRPISGGGGPRPISQRLVPRPSSRQDVERRIRCVSPTALVAAGWYMPPSSRASPTRQLDSPPPGGGLYEEAASELPPELLLLLGCQASARRQLTWDCDVPSEFSFVLEECPRSWLPAKDRAMAEAVHKLQDRADNAARRERLQKERQAALQARAKATAEAAAVARLAAEAHEVRQQELEAAELAGFAEKVLRKARLRSARRSARSSQNQFAMRLEDETPWALKRITAKDGWVWSHGVQFPDICANELWDALSSSKDQVCTWLPADQFIDQFMSCRQALTPEFAKALEKLDENCRLLWTGKALAARLETPEPMLRSQLARLCALYLEAAPGQSLDRRLLLEEMVKVRELQPRDPDTAFGITDDTYLRLQQYKRILSDAAWLMGFPESIVIAEIAWFRGQVFALPKALCTVLVNSALNRDRNWGNLQFSANDMTRLCYALNVIDSKGKRGFALSKIALMFQSVLKNMPILVIKSRSRRPHHWLWDKPGVPGGRRLMKVEHMLDELDPLRKDPNRTMLGFTEFSALLVEIFEALPEKMFISPMEMCARCLNSAANAKLTSSHNIEASTGFIAMRRPNSAGPTGQATQSVTAGFSSIGHRRAATNAEEPGSPRPPSAPPLPAAPGAAAAGRREAPPVAATPRSRSPSSSCSALTDSEDEDADSETEDESDVTGSPSPSSPDGSRPSSPRLGVPRPARWSRPVLQ